MLSENEYGSIILSKLAAIALSISWFKALAAPVSLLFVKAVSLNPLIILFQLAEFCKGWTTSPLQKLLRALI